MRLNSFAAATAAAATLVAAHGDIPGAPKIFGRSPFALKARNVFDNSHEHAVAAAENRPQKRQAGGTDGQCGAGVGTCAEGYCCSGAGWCGTGSDYCAAPDCQFSYGPGCDANATPPGDSTAGVARSLVGDVEYGGVGIYSCEVAGTVALTYDDGPGIYTSDVLDILSSYNAKATFFITGINNGKGEIDNEAYAWPGIIRRMASEGHQIASHTWSHQDLSAITSDQRKAQMIKNEMALRNILGKFPTYMRPPYSSCTAESGCEDDLKALGYHVTYFDVDTDDYENDSPSLIQNSKNRFDTALTGGSSSTSDFLVIGHDIHEQTVHNLTAYMLTALQAQGYRAVTVGECLGDPEANWYRSSSGSVFTSTPASNPTSPPSSTSAGPTASPTGVSTDGTCGANGATCLNSEFGNCCSQHGWCGSTSDHCGTGCQTGFGSCGSSSAPVSANSASTSVSPISSVSLSSVSSVSPSVSPSVSISFSKSAASPTAGKVSTDGSCGTASGFTCQGSTFGNCCSQYGWCGSDSDHCSNNCQTAFGTCGTQVTNAGATTLGTSSLTTSTVRATSVAVAPTSTTTSISTTTSTTTTSKVSTNGRCGSSNGGMTCAGASGCCNRLGFCGGGLAYCGLVLSGCQKGYSSGCWNF